MLPRRPFLLLSAALLVVVAAAGAYVLLKGDDAITSTGTPAGAAPAVTHPADYGRSIPAGGKTLIDQVAAADALCRVQPSSIRALAQISDDSTRIENLRDGLELLDERLARLQDAVVGRPAVKPVITSLTGIRDAWTAAIAANDRHQTAKAKRAMTVAGTRLDALDRALARAYPDRQSDCA